MSTRVSVPTHSSDRCQLTQFRRPKSLGYDSANSGFSIRKLFGWPRLVTPQLGFPSVRWTLEGRRLGTRGHRKRPDIVRWQRVSVRLGIVEILVGHLVLEERSRTLLAGHEIGVGRDVVVLAIDGGRRAVVLSAASQVMSNHAPATSTGSVNVTRMVASRGALVPFVRGSVPSTNGPSSTIGAVCLVAGSPVAKSLPLLSVSTLPCPPGRST